MLHHLCFNIWTHNTRVIHTNILKLLIIWDLRFLVVVVKSSIFWDSKLCSPLKINKRSRKTWMAHVTSKTSIDFQRITQCYIPEDRTLLKC
jgi:hypothetical protein